MPNYPVQTIASAPEGSKSALEQLKKAFGVVPNIVGAIATSPKLINSLVGLFGQVHSPGPTIGEIKNRSNYLAGNRLMRIRPFVQTDCVPAIESCARIPRAKTSSPPDFPLTDFRR